MNRNETVSFIRSPRGLHENERKTLADVFTLIWIAHYDEFLLFLNIKKETKENSFEN